MTDLHLFLIFAVVAIALIDIADRHREGAR